jgi:hypothetical protein
MGAAAARARLWGARDVDARNASYDPHHYPQPIGPVRMLWLVRQVPVYREVVIHHIPTKWIVESICRARGVTVEEVNGRCRFHPFVAARGEIAHKLRSRGMSLPQIGVILGGRDHTTILHMLRAYDPQGKRVSK